MRQTTIRQLKFPVLRYKKKIDFSFNVLKDTLAERVFFKINDFIEKYFFLLLGLIISYLIVIFIKVR